jgi:hypothetical protein
MMDYRFYAVDARGQSFAPPVVIQCDGDGDALLQGRSLAGDRPLEIWEGTRRVGTIPTAVDFDIDAEAFSRGTIVDTRS